VSHSGVTEDLSVLGCETVGQVVPLSVGGQPVQEADGYSVILRKVSNYLPSDTVSHPTRLECSSLWNFGQYIPCDKYRNTLSLSLSIYIYIYIYLFIYLFFKYNQKDATLYNILYSMSMLYMFQAVSPPIIRSSKTVHTASGVGRTCLLLPLAWVSSNSPTLVVAASKLDIYLMLCVQFLSS